MIDLEAADRFGQSTIHMHTTIEIAGITVDAYPITINSIGGVARSIAPYSDGASARAVCPKDRPSKARTAIQVALFGFMLIGERNKSSERFWSVVSLNMGCI